MWVKKHYDNSERGQGCIGCHRMITLSNKLLKALNYVTLLKCLIFSVKAEKYNIAMGTSHHNRFRLYFSYNLASAFRLNMYAF